MQKEFQLAVDIEKKILTPSFEVNTLDLKSVKLQITITKGMTLVDLTGVAVLMSIRKPDNNIIFQECQIINAKGGKVEIILENQAYLLPGSYSAEIMCFKGSDVVAVTGSFSYKSVRGIMTDEAVESKSEFTAITKTIDEVNKTVTDLREKGTGIDAKARQDIQTVTTQLTDIVTVNLNVTNEADITNDIVNAISQINENGGGILNIPYRPSGYNVGIANINLCNNLTINGNGNTFYVTSSSTPKMLFKTTGFKHIKITDMNVKSPMDVLVPRSETPNVTRYTSNVYLFSLQGENLVIENIFTDGMEMCIMFNHPTLLSKNIKIKNIKTINTNQPLFIKNLNDAFFDNLDFDCSQSWSGLDHHIYINGNSSNLFFNKLLLKEGKQTYAIQVKRDSDNIPMCNNIHFTNITMNNAHGINISDSTNVFVEGIQATSPGFDGYCVRVDKVNNFFLSRFHFEGSYSGLLSVTNSTHARTNNGNLINTNQEIKSNQINLINCKEGYIDNVKFQAIKFGSHQMLYSANSTSDYIIRNSKFIFNDAICSIRGADNVIFENNTFINNKGVNIGFVMWNKSPAKVIAKNNYYKGFTSFLYVADDTATTEYTNIPMPL